MHKHIFMTLSLVLLASCAGKPHKAEKIDTTIENTQKVGDEEVGVKDGNMIVRRKTLMGEELRRIQNEVYELEDRVYGNTKFHSRGLYGNLKSCKTELADKKNGGDGKLQWQEPIDRVTDKEEDLKIGLDDKNKLVGISDEYLKDRIDRFKTYKQILLKREDEYETKIEVCHAELKSRKPN